MAHADVLFNVSRCGEVLRITADIEIIRVLVHTDPIDTKCRRECKVVVVDEAEVLGNTQVHDQVLGCRRCQGDQHAHNEKHEHVCTHHRFLRHRAVIDLHNVVCTHASHIEPPRKLSIADPRHVGVTEPRLVLEAIRRELLPAELVSLLVYGSQAVSHTCSPPFDVIRTSLRNDGRSLLIDSSAVIVQEGLGGVWDNEIVRGIAPNVLVVEWLHDALVNLGYACDAKQLTAH